MDIKGNEITFALGIDKHLHPFTGIAGTLTFDTPLSNLKTCWIVIPMSSRLIDKIFESEEVEKLPSKLTVAIEKAIIYLMHRLRIFFISYGLLLSGNFKQSL